MRRTLKISVACILLSMTTASGKDLTQASSAWSGSTNQRNNALDAYNVMKPKYNKALEDTIILEYRLHALWKAEKITAADYDYVATCIASSASKLSDANNLTKEGDVAWKDGETSHSLGGKLTVSLEFNQACQVFALSTAAYVTSHTKYSSARDASNEAQSWANEADKVLKTYEQEIDCGHLGACP